MRCRKSGAFARALFVVTCAASIAGCGRAAPTGPTSSPTPVSATPAAPNGATISGTVVGVSSSSQINTQRVSLTVNVTGTSILSTVDDNGRFTLANVPPGHIDLHFTGAGVDAHLGLDGVADNARLFITVRVSGNDAHLEDDHGPNPGPGNGNLGEAEVSGTIAAGGLTGSCTAHNLSFLVGATRVTTNASTLFRDGPCDSLGSGARVEVKGARQSDNSLLAVSIERDDDDENEDEDGVAEVKGMIAAGSLAGSCSAQSLSFRVGPTLIRTNVSTQFKDVSCTSLKGGDSVEAKGSRQADASVLASRVERQ